MKTGLVLEGGAMRGMFTAGVLDSWMDEQISFDGIVGVSAGALFGINAPAGQKGRAIRYNLKYIRDKRYMGARSLLTTGNLINADFAFYEVSSSWIYLMKRPFRDRALTSMPRSPICTGASGISGSQSRSVRWRSCGPPLPCPMSPGLWSWMGDSTWMAGSATVFQSISARVWATTRPFSCSHVPWSIGKSGPRMASSIQPPLLPSLSGLCGGLNRRWEVYNRQVEEIIGMERRGELFVVRPNGPLPIRRVEKDPAMAAGCL